MRVDSSGDDEADGSVSSSSSDSDFVEMNVSDGDDDARGAATQKDLSPGSERRAAKMAASDQAANSNSHLRTEQPQEEEQHRIAIEAEREEEAAAAEEEQNTSIVLEEAIVAHAATPEEVSEYAQWLGMDLATDQVLLWIAEEGIDSKLPPGCVSISSVLRASKM